MGDGAGKIKLKLVNVYNEAVRQPAVVKLRTSGGSLLNPISIDHPKTIILVDGLVPDTFYAIQVYVHKHYPFGLFLRADEKPGVVSQTVVMDSEQVGTPAFDGWNELPTDLQAIAGNAALETYPGQQGETLFGLLGDTEKAGFLNIMAKAAQTFVAERKSILGYLKPPEAKMFRLRGDRVFFEVPAALRDMVKDARLRDIFDEAPGSLHTPPRPGYQLADSYKSRDRYGNLQLTFFKGPGPVLADIDIDDANGVGHIFQVLDHWLTKNETHPYDIHQILRRYQHIETWYRLKV